MPARRKEVGVCGRADHQASALDRPALKGQGDVTHAHQCSTQPDKLAEQQREAQRATALEEETREIIDSCRITQSITRHSAGFGDDAAALAFLERATQVGGRRAPALHQACAGGNTRADQMN